MTADDDPRCDFCERRFIRIKNGVAVCEKHLGPTPDSGNLRCGICGGTHDAYSALCPPERGKRCGHTHDCACGRNLPLAHRDPNYRRQGFCAQPCAYCDALDASEAGGVR